jgi:hypothetical protein
MNSKYNQQILLVVCVIVAIAVIWWVRHRKEKFTPDIPTLDKIRIYVDNASQNLDYSGEYLKFVVDNNMSEPEYLEQSFFYGLIALKKLGMLTNENMTKLM